MPEGDTPSEREYYFVEDLITKFNSDCLEIKKWSVTTASAVAVAGQFGGTPAVVQLSIIAALAVAFWVTETLWRMNQWAFIRSVQHMESCGVGPLVSNRWTRYYLGRDKFNNLIKKPGDWWNREAGEASIGRALFHFVALRTSLPHGLIAILAAGLLAALHLHWLPTDDSGGTIKLELPLHAAAGKSG